MKDKIIILIIGILIGAIISTFAFYIYIIGSNNCNQQINQNGQPPSMTNNSNQPPDQPSGDNSNSNQPPDKPSGDSTENNNSENNTNDNKTQNNN